MKFASRKSALCAAAAAAVVPLLDAPSAYGQAAVVTGVYTNTGPGAWNNPANWDTNPNYPSGVGAGATIPSNHSAHRTVSLDEDVTVGSIRFENDTSSINDVGQGTAPTGLTFDAVDGGPAIVTVVGTGTGNSRITAAMVLNDSLTLDVLNEANGTAGAFGFYGDVSGSGGVTKTGAGRMTWAFAPGTQTGFKTYTGPTVISNGRVRMSHGARPTATSSFTIENGGQLVPISGTTNTYDFGVGPLSISGNGPTTGPDAPFKGAIVPTVNFHVTFTNPIVLPDGPGVIHSRATSVTNGSITLTNAISGPGTLQLSPDAGDGQFGTYFLKSTASDYTGGTTIWGGTVDATQANLGATIGPLSVNVIPYGGFAQTTLLLNTSMPTTVGSLSGIRNGHESTINNGEQLFTVNQMNDATYDGVITGAGGFTMGSLGTSRLTLTGANTYTGDTTLAGGTLAVSSEANIGTSTSPINFAGGNLQTDAPINFTRNAAVTAGTGGINTNGFDSTINTVSGAGGFTKSGGGKLTATQVKLGGPLAVNAGALEVAPNGAAAGTVETTALSIPAGGALRLNDNDLIVDYADGATSPEVAIRQLVKAGRVDQSTTGIFSTPGATRDNVLLAVVDNSDWGQTTYNGSDVDTSTVIGKYTYFGDANLDGKVTGDDYVAVDSNLGTGDSWIEGDFNMDGRVSGDDYVAIDSNLGSGTPDPLAFAELKAEMVAVHVEMFGEGYLAALAAYEAEMAVPEPGALSLIALGTLGLLGRRRRK